MNGNFLEKAITEIAEAAARNNPPREGDYYENGLLMCGKCHTQKEVLITYHEKKKKFSCMCECKAQEEDAREQTERKVRLENQLREMRKSGIYNPEYRKMTFARDDRKNEALSVLCRSYVKNWEKMEKENGGLLLYGNTGTGKTFYACCIANALIDMGIGAMVTTVDRLIGAMRENFEANKADVIYKIQNMPFLVLDDVGRERDTEYVNEKLDEIIDARYTAGRPLIVTTNLTMDTLKNPPFQVMRAYDRLLEMCAPVAVISDSRRLKRQKR